jgi:hypothetical protein
MQIESSVIPDDASSTTMTQIKYRYLISTVLSDRMVRMIRNDDIVHTVRSANRYIACTAPWPPARIRFLPSGQ